MALADKSSLAPEENDDVEDDDNDDDDDDETITRLFLDFVDCAAVADALINALSCAGSVGRFPLPLPVPFPVDGPLRSPIRARSAA